MSRVALDVAGAPLSTIPGVTLCSAAAVRRVPAGGRS
ncbi:MAG: hypothetical protein JWM18_1908 [Chloroflexi bacterium]|jgi:hypothetical protein|nr:hypothetical protein [Chloroflexota bacterium]